LSILITDSQIARDDSGVKSSERNARYDGLISFGSSLTMVIENKPRSGNVWFGQLNPSRQNLGDDTIVYSNPIILEWKEIIKQLNCLLTVPTISGYEKIMIEDFLSYVDESFPFLNPYDGFHQCKGNAELINRRIHNLLKSISLEEGKVCYHRNGSSYIQTPYPEIERICLGLNQSEKDYSIDLGLYFADTQRQAAAFYKSAPKLDHLKNSEWSISPNFHVSFRSTGLVWFESEESENYLQFWKDNVEDIHQQKRADIPKYFKRLADEKVISMTQDAKDRLNEKFYQTKMPNLNICPGLGAVFSVNSSDAQQLDKSGKLKFLLSEKIREGLKIVGLDGKEVLKKL
jgi:hypothetical protein